MYISDATDIFSLSYCVGYASAFLAMALYSAFMPGLRGLIVMQQGKGASARKVSSVK